MKTKVITIVDYGAGNIGSLVNMIEHVGGRVQIAKTAEDISKCEKLLIPGVGAFKEAMQLLSKLDLISVLKEKVISEKVPTMGICLGMHLLTEYSEEGDVPGLGFIKGNTQKFNFQGEQASLKVPHMGWQKVFVTKSSKLFDDKTNERPRFYFVHSYKVCDVPKDLVLVDCDYGGLFTAGFEKENILGLQFHAEKSSHHGMRLFKNFVERF